MKVDVYTDGSCTYNGQKNAKASYAYYFPEYKEHSGAGRVPDDHPQTNNRGELMGILEAVKKVEQVFPASDIELQIYTDSQYCKNCLTIWYPKWVSNGWKTATGAPVVNRELVEDITNRFLSLQSYKITYVRAHTGGDDEMSKNNHIVDRMAVEVIDPPKKEVIERVKKIPGPLQLLGPPVSETSLYGWIQANQNQLDSGFLKTALISAYTKTMKKNGYDVVKQKLHRTNEYRLSIGTHLTESQQEE
jgi:ribonuclease HI